MVHVPPKGFGMFWQLAFNGHEGEDLRRLCVFESVPPQSFLRGTRDSLTFCISCEVAPFVWSKWNSISSYEDYGASFHLVKE